MIQPSIYDWTLFICLTLLTFWAFLVNKFLIKKFGGKK